MYVNLPIKMQIYILSLSYLMATKQREESLFLQSALIHMFANFFGALLQSCFQQEIHEPSFAIYVDRSTIFGVG